MASEQGYSNQKKKGKAQFKTIHSVNSDAFGTANIPKYLFDIDPADKPIVSIADIIGKDGQVEFWNLEITGHLAAAGGMIRLVDGSLKNFEFEVMSVPDANHVYVLPISSSKPAISDNVRVMGWVTGRADDEGNPISSQGPVQFKLDNVTTEVSKDSLVPANTIALPVEDFEARSKLTLLEAKDFATETTLASLEAKDFATQTTLASLEAKDFATQTTLASLEAKDFATSAKQDTGNTSLSSIDGKLQVAGVIDPNNSSVTPLGISGVFTGTAFEVTKYAVINVNVASDVPSATDGLKVEFSEDGTNWDHSHKTTYSAATGVGYIFNAEFRYARVVYTNGAVAQAYFRLQTIFKSTYVPPSLYTLDQTVTGSMFAQLQKSTIIGKTTGGGGGFVDVKVTPSGALTAEATVTGSVSISNFPATQPVSAASLPLPSGASTLAEQQTQTTAIGSLTETAPATDTASSGINGRLQRIAQRITSLIALFPASLGQKSMADSFAVTLSSDQSTLPVVQTALTASYQEITNLTITAQTFTAPVGAKWCKIYAEDTNVADIRVRIGGTATVTSGLQLQPGRSEDFNAVGNISVIAESGINQRVNVHFGV